MTPDRLTARFRQRCASIARMACAHRRSRQLSRVNVVIRLRAIEIMAAAYAVTFVRSTVVSISDCGLHEGYRPVLFLQIARCEEWFIDRACGSGRIGTHQPNQH
jgi:hypothetical protein